MNTPVRRIVAWARADWARGTTEPAAKPVGGPRHPHPVMVDEERRRRAWAQYHETGHYPSGDDSLSRVCNALVMAFAAAFWAVVAAVAVALVIGLPMALWSGPEDQYGPGTGDTPPTNWPVSVPTRH